MFLFVLYPVLAIIYLAIPLFAKLIVFILNIFIPDPIPAIDEIFMGLSIFRNIGIWYSLSTKEKALRIVGFICLMLICILILFN